VCRGWCGARCPRRGATMPAAAAAFVSLCVGSCYIYLSCMGVSSELSTTFAFSFFVTFSSHAALCDTVI
jgi:hypothetical protein